MAATAFPEVIILRLGDEKSVSDEKYGDKVGIIKETFATKEVFEAVLHPVNEPQPKAIIVVPTRIGSLNQKDIRSRLSRFVNAGGTVIIAFLFLAENSEWELEPLFWDLKRKWKVDSSAPRHARLKLSLSAPIKEKMASASNDLQQTYEIEALKITGVVLNEMVYIDSKSHITGDPAQDCYVGCPSAFARIGSGNLGYIGDLRVTSGTVALLMAMLTRAVGPRHLNRPTSSSIDQRITAFPPPSPLQAWNAFTHAPSQPTLSVRSPASQTTIPAPTPSGTHEQKDVSTSMPPLAPCNPGCAVCTILLPAIKCTGCRKAQYCSVGCQTTAWPVHRLVCGDGKAGSRDGGDGGEEK